jgi:NAD(P)-dependent dehydrogenase (short-subunit alcohol dehydrogenase family)
MTLTDTRVVVLGGTSGIGLATARHAAALGARVVVGSRSSESVERALAELPPGSEGHTVDAGSSRSLAGFYETVGDHDHFVFTAGENLVPLPLADYTPQAGRTFFELRVVRALEALALAVPHLRTGGSVTLTSGTAAYRGGAGWTLGSAASGAVVSAVRSLAVELAPLRVNAVAPGVVRTPLWDRLGDTEREAAFSGTGSLLGRVAEVDDVAAAYCHLMASDYVTGTVELVDGGTLLV